MVACVVAMNSQKCCFQGVWALAPAAQCSAVPHPLPPCAKSDKLPKTKERLEKEEGEGGQVLGASAWVWARCASVGHSVS